MTRPTAKRSKIVTAVRISSRSDDNPFSPSMLDRRRLIESLRPLVVQEGFWDWYRLAVKPWVEHCGDWTWCELSDDLVLTVRHAAQCEQWHCPRCGWEFFARDYLGDASECFSSVSWVYVVRYDDPVGWEAAYTQDQAIGRAVRHGDAVGRLAVDLL